MEIQQYFDIKKKLYNSVLSFIDDFNCDDHDFQSLIAFIKSNNIQESREELSHLLRLISNLIDSHHRNPYFFEKIEKIILNIKDAIQQFFSNIEIFDIFKSNKRIVLFLLEKEIVKLDQSIFSYMIQKVDLNGTKYCHFFLPEIEKFNKELKNKDVEKILSEVDSSIYVDYDKKRREGENDSYICTLIREESVTEFISYVNRKNISLSSKILPSIFETNLFLIENEPTLIEYAAFFGSIEIFQFLFLNNVTINYSVWMYGIHSNNSDLLRNHIETNITEQNDKCFEELLKESIKCHHNDITEYIGNYLINQELFDSKLQTNFTENVVECIFQYSNYSFYPNDINKNFVFFHLCDYGYNKIVNLYMEMKKNDIEKSIISNEELNQIKIKI